LYAIGVSRATNKLDEIKAFYSKDIGIELLTEKKYDDGSQSLTYMWEVPKKGI